MTELTLNPVTFSSTGEIQKATVEYAGYYDITAEGAQGGSGYDNSPGGFGAKASGLIWLQAGAQLEIVVGSPGDSGQYVGGGGGGSFVIETNDGSGGVDVNEVIAGGGGGGGGGFLHFGGIFQQLTNGVGPYTAATGGPAAGQMKGTGGKGGGVAGGAGELEPRSGDRRATMGDFMTGPPERP